MLRSLRLLTVAACAAMLGVAALPTVAHAVADGSIQVSKLAYRLAGVDRFETAAVLARDGWPNGSSAAVLATGMNWPDALAAGPVGYTNDIPVLLTTKDALPATTDAALTELRVGKLYLIGGPAVISTALETSLAQRFQVVRIWGENRYGTAAAAARYVVGAAAGQVTMVRGDAFPDALQASLDHPNAPLLLTPPASDLAPETKAVLQELLPSAVLGLGDPAAIGAAGAAVQALGLSWSTSPVVDAIDRSVTEYAGTGPMNDVALVSGVNWPDAIATTPWTSRFDVHVFLTQANCMRQSLFDKLDLIDPIGYLGVIGGPAAVADGVLGVKGPDGVVRIAVC